MAQATAILQEKGIDPSNIKIWFADEARIGQKKKITYRWARRATRSSAPTDQRTASDLARVDRPADIEECIRQRVYKPEYKALV